MPTNRRPSLRSQPKRPNGGGSWKIILKFPAIETELKRETRVREIHEKHAPTKYDAAFAGFATRPETKSKR